MLQYLLSNMDPLEFYKLAVYLIKNPMENHDATIRTCISRAYYAAFLVARDKAGIKNSGGSVHKDVREHYLSTNPTLHNRLKNLFQRRSGADYNMARFHSDREAGIAINICKDIIKELKK